MKNVFIQPLTIALLGLFAGGCIAVLCILIPFWHSLSPSELMLWFHNYGPTVAVTMLPMQIIPLLLSIYIYFLLRKTSGSAKNMWLWVNTSNVVVLIMLLVYFVPVNIELVNQTMNPAIVPSELARWEAIHVARTALTVFSTALAVVAYSTFAQPFMRAKATSRK